MVFLQFARYCGFWVNAACKGLLSTASKLSECFKAVMQTEKKLVEPNAIVSVMAYN